MNGTLAQQLSLVSYGNHFLKTGSLPADYYPANVAFNFCNQVDFRYLATEPDAAQPTETVVAADPPAWLHLLRQQGCQQLRLAYYPSGGNQLSPPDYKLAGFVGGGGTWLLAALAGPHADYWASRWEVTRPKDPDQLIWAVSYGRMASGPRPSTELPALGPARQKLAEALTAIQAFAEEQQLNHWAAVFQKALATLASPEPAVGLYQQLLVAAEHPLPAQQLIFAAGQAFVFGGMGSWNDLGFADEPTNQRYEELSGQLYTQVNHAVVAGINAAAS